MKKNYKLRIFIYGKEALNDIRYICNNIDPKMISDYKFKVKPFHSVDKETGWEYFIFNNAICEDANETIKNYLNEHYKGDNMLKANDEIKDIIQSHSNDKDNEKLNEKISDVLIKYRNFYDVLVISVDNLLDEDSKAAFEFFQGFTNKKSEQPFVLFLTKKDNNPKIQNLFEFVTNEFFDKRNVFAKKFPSNDKEIEDIHKFFYKSMYYYHEVGNSESNAQVQTFNILICGQAGVGKSSFINQFLREKVAKEGEGLSVTHEITNYIHPEFPIRLYDTPGFENDDTVKMVTRTVEKFENDMKESKNHLDLVLYLNELKQRNFFSLEIDFIKYLLTQNKKIIFVVNDFKNNKKSEQKKLMDTYKDSLTKIINTMESTVRERKDEILSNMILINLKQQLFEYEDEEGESKTTIKQCYGLDQLFKKMYELFYDKKISITEIESANNVTEMQQRMKKFELLENLSKLEDIFIRIKINSSKAILSYSKYDWFVLFFRDSRRKKLLKEINEINQGKSIDNINSLFTNIKDKVAKIKDKKEFIQEFFNSIKRFKGVFKTEGFNFDAYFYNEYTLLVGYTYLKDFEREYGQYDEKSKKFLRQFAKSLNEAIDGFDKISKDWVETYASLKAHKSNKEWVNRYFIIDLPK